MKYLVVSCILFFCTLQTFGQQDYFIYLQTDNSQPFYARVNNNVYSSSSTGYLILFKLGDSSHSVTIGFPRNVFPEQQFNIPVNHKDAGYLLKNFGDKGWGLFNFQTLSVIMNGNPPDEKKNTEISGTRKNDAFSLLLATAVNDTAVLYTVNRPPKPAPAPPVAAVEEKKKDTVAILKKQAQDDSAALVKITAKEDSGLTAKSIPKEPAAIATKKKTNPDSAALVKNAKPPAAQTDRKNNIARKNNTALAKHASGQRKDTIIVRGRPASRQHPLAKNKDQRKDTIIIMDGKAPGNDRLNAKDMALEKKKAPVKDTLQLKKEIIFAPEEKRNALLNNHDAVVIQKIPIEKDSGASSSEKKDTIIMLSGNEPAKPTETKADTLVSAPAKRWRPLVNKEAELLTDTSYIAVFVDESKEKFDTIRISIPFNEESMNTRRERPVTEPAPAADTAKTIKDSVPPAIANQVPPAVIKKEKEGGDSILKNNRVIEENVPVAVKTDSAFAGKKMNGIADTAAITAQKAPMPVDTGSVAAPAGQLTKAPPQPLFLNSDCKEVAFDSDIDKLRIKMLLVVSDEDRIGLAKKVFRQKCFLVKQVRALSELFKSDEGKYKWFDASYPFVSDTGNFSSLAELIKDDYYLNRFKAMLRH